MPCLHDPLISQAAWNGMTMRSMCSHIGFGLHVQSKVKREYNVSTHCQHHTVSLTHQRQGIIACQASFDQLAYACFFAKSSGSPDFAKLISWLSPSPASCWTRRACAHLRCLQFAVSIEPPGALTRTETLWNASTGFTSKDHGLLNAQVLAGIMRSLLRRR